MGSADEDVLVVQTNPTRWRVSEEGVSLPGSLLVLVVVGAEFDEAGERGVR